MIFERRVWLLLVALFVWMSSAACGSRQTRSEDGWRSDLPDEGPEPGELEAQLKVYLDDITDLLTTESDDPQHTVVSIGRYLSNNQEEIFRVAGEVRRRIEGMSEPERLYYQERFSEYFIEATRSWYDALHDFRQEHPQHALLIDGLMSRFD